MIKLRSTTYYGLTVCVKFGVKGVKMSHKTQPQQVGEKLNLELQSIVKIIFCSLCFRWL